MEDLVLSTLPPGRTRKAKATTVDFQRKGNRLAGSFSTMKKLPRLSGLQTLMLTGK
jgi:hypothetical protein